MILIYDLLFGKLNYKILFLRKLFYTVENKTDRGFVFDTI